MTSEIKRISTGNEQADEILKGGFPVNSINIIMGQPGTGKTIFAERLAFANADGTRPILFLTTLSEPLAKVLTYLQQFEFFDEEKIGSQIYYQDIGSELAKDGVSALLPKINEAIRTISPKIIIIDSFKALHDVSQSVLEMRRMLFEMTGALTAYETTAFLLGEYTDTHSRTLPEFALADGIIQFMRNEQNTRDERFMRVQKLRGSGYLEGSHSFTISDKGLDIFPRLVTPKIPREYTLTKERVPSGINGLDEIIGGGLMRGSATLVAGSTGAGKTTLGLQFALARLERGEGRSIVLNFQENPTQLVRTLSNLTGKDELPEGLELMYVSPVEMQIDSVTVSLFKRIQTEKVGRVVIDSVGDMSMAASDAGRLHDYLYALIQHFAVKGITSLITFELIGGVTDTGALVQMGRISYMSDNIFLLDTKKEPKVHRQITCVKARGSKHDLAPHEIEIAQDGLSVIS